MAVLQRYTSFEELKKSVPASKKVKPSKVTPGQKIFKEFGELLRKGIKHASSPKK